MDRLTCDRCGEGLYHDIDVRYEVKIEVKSGYDVMEITSQDLERDFNAELERLVREAEKRTDEELEAEVYKAFQFDLCATCQREYVKDPLGRNRRDP